MEDLRGPAVGPFGPVYPGFTDSPEGAIAHLMEMKTGEVTDAFVHPELGPIEFVYGDEKLGLRHIEKKRSRKFVESVPSVLREGRFLRLPDRNDRVYVVVDGDPATVAVVRLDYNQAERTWLVTAFKDEWETIAARQARTSNETPASASSQIPDATGQRVEDMPSGAADQSRPAPDGEPDLAALDPKEAEGRLAAAQPFDDVDGLYRLAPEAQHAFEQFMGAIATRHEGVIWKNPGLKERGTVEEKIARKGYRSVRQLIDIVRGGLVVPTAEAADAVVADFAGRFTLIDGGWVRNAFGFVDRKLTVRMPNGVVAEVPIWAGPMYEAKATKGQALYTEARSSSDPARIDALREELIALYSAAMAEADPSFEKAAGTSSGPKVFWKRSDSASAEPRTAPAQATLSASTETQGPPGSSRARASVDENATAGRLSQSQNTGYSDGIAKNPDRSDSKDIGDRSAFANPAAPDGEPDPEGDAIRAAIADFRADDAIEIPLPDGSTKSIRVAELLDEIRDDLARVRELSSPILMAGKNTSLSLTTRIRPRSRPCASTGMIRKRSGWLQPTSTTEGSTVPGRCGRQTSHLQVRHRGFLTQPGGWEIMHPRRRINPGPLQRPTRRRDLCLMGSGRGFRIRAIAVPVAGSDGAAGHAGSAGG